MRVAVVRLSVILVEVFRLKECWGRIWTLESDEVFKPTSGASMNNIKAIGKQ
jgi:hypothetical protein